MERNTHGHTDLECVSAGLWTAPQSNSGLRRTTKASLAPQCQEASNGELWSHTWLLSHTSRLNPVIASPRRWRISQIPHIPFLPCQSCCPGNKSLLQGQTKGMKFQVMADPSLLVPASFISLNDAALPSLINSDWGLFMHKYRARLHRERER